ncbi:MAG: alpha-L-fucosidase [Verrucomicrobiota bacterium]
MHSVSLFPFLLALQCLAHAGPIEPGLLPNGDQHAMIDRRYGMFIHFGINTFSGHEWTNGTLKPEIYNPTNLDTDQWARTAKEAGMSYVILITKHHDGFCLWNSPQTEYDVATSPVKTDVVAAMAKSCKKYGMKLGLYYSLWDRNWDNGVMRGDKPKISEEKSREYLAYMKSQLTELLANYGDVCELWFDGGWVLPREQWHIAEVYAHCKKLQPRCLVGINWSIGQFGNVDHHPIRPKDYRIGQPMRYYPGDFRLGDPELPVFPDVKHFAGPDGRLHYLPFETTVCLNKHWFWQPYDQDIRSVAELLPLYERSTAQDNVLILNSPPNRDGLMDQRNIDRLKELSIALGAKPGAPVPADLSADAIAFADSVWTADPGDWSARAAIDGNPDTRWAAATTTPTITLTWPAARTISMLRIREHFDRVRAFEVETNTSGKWTQVHKGTTIGPNSIIRFPATTTTAVRMKITQAAEPPSFIHISAADPRSK